MLIRGEAQMRKLGANIMAATHSGGVIALHGNLGTGKTTLVRGALEFLGVTKGVRSPTYTLIEYYAFDSLSVAISICIDWCMRKNSNTWDTAIT